MRQLILGTASVLALGIGGVAFGFAPDAGTAVNAVSCPPASQTADSSGTAANLHTDDARWALQELRKDDVRWGQL